MRAKDLMTKKLITAKENDSIESIIKSMADNDIGFIPIVNDERKVLGVITDRDIAIRILKSNISQPIKDIMTYTFISAHADDDITIVLRLMGDYQLRRIIILNDESKLAGVISIADIAINKQTNALLNETMREISMQNLQKDKPLRYLEVDDFRL